MGKRQKLLENVVTFFFRKAFHVFNLGGTFSGHTLQTKLINIDNYYEKY